MLDLLMKRGINEDNFWCVGQACVSYTFEHITIILTSRFSDITTEVENKIIVS